MGLEAQSVRRGKLIFIFEGQGYVDLGLKSWF